MIKYAHSSYKDETIDLPVGKVVCVGRNYRDHVKEMASTVTREPILFIKPQDALCRFSPTISIPAHLGACHNEIEVALLIKSTLNRRSQIHLDDAIWGVSLGLDLTLRDIQAQLKMQGHPWERAKSFDNSCPVSAFIPWQFNMAQSISFSLDINGEQRQVGNTQDMIFPIPALLRSIAQVFTLHPGDVVMTGTPSGVGPLRPGDQLHGVLNDDIHITSQVVSWP